MPVCVGLLLGLVLPTVILVCRAAFAVPAAAFGKWPVPMRRWLIHPHNFQQRYVAVQVDG
jgi:hypothetical protein